MPSGKNDCNDKFQKIPASLTNLATNLLKNNLVTSVCQILIVVKLCRSLNHKDLN